MSRGATPAAAAVDGSNGGVAANGVAASGTSASGTSPSGVSASGTSPSGNGAAAMTGGASAGTGAPVGGPAAPRAAPTAVSTAADAAALWDLAVTGAALAAVDPAGLGVLLRAGAGPVRDHWLALLAELLPPGAPCRRLPAHIGDDRLLGGLDLGATLRQGRRVVAQGLLAEAHGGVVVVPMAERLTAGITARVVAALDRGRVSVEREGVGCELEARIGVVALDEAVEADEAVPAALADRLAVHLELRPVAWRELGLDAPTPEEVAAARRGLPAVEPDEPSVRTLCEVALALGVDGLRAPILALRTARAAAALAGRTTLSEADLATATRLVLAPRATRVPAAAEPPSEETDETAGAETGEEASPQDQTPGDQPGQEGREPPAPDEASAPAGADDTDGEATEADPAGVAERLVDSARAVLPEGLLAALARGEATRGTTAGRGAGAQRRGGRRGRPVGVRAGRPGPGAPLDVVATLRAAAPWQPLRRREAGGTPARIQVRPEDFRTTRYRARTATTTIFAVDASGSAALSRLNEAKGAVELLLADSYVRRDRVALLAFRGPDAEILLPPTRSLTRARRCLAALPGGGGTPLAAGIEAARAVADEVRRAGETPVLVLLTDGRANVGLDGVGGRARAREDALASAARLAAADHRVLVVDTSARSHAAARELAAAAGGRYLALPRAGAEQLSAAIRPVPE